MAHERVQRQFQAMGQLAGRHIKLEQSKEFKAYAHNRKNHIVQIHPKTIFVCFKEFLF